MRLCVFGFQCIWSEWMWDCMFIVFKVMWVLMGIFRLLTHIYKALAIALDHPSALLGEWWVNAFWDKHSTQIFLLLIPLASSCVDLCYLFLFYGCGVFYLSLFKEQIQCDAVSWPGLGQSLHVFLWPIGSATEYCLLLKCVIESFVHSFECS